MNKSYPLYSVLFGVLLGLIFLELKIYEGKNVREVVTEAAISTVHAQTKPKKGERMWIFMHKSMLPVTGEPVAFVTKSDHVVHSTSPLPGWECSFLAANSSQGTHARGLFCKDSRTLLIYDLSCPTRPGVNRIMFSLSTLDADGDEDTSAIIAVSCETY